MTPKSTRKTGRGKAAKPRPDFPLFPHATGRWAKKVHQKLHYFGPTADDPKGQSARDERGGPAPKISNVRWNTREPRSRPSQPTDGRKGGAELDRHPTFQVQVVDGAARLGYDSHQYDDNLPTFPF